MRLLQVLTLALLATAARADIAPCVTQTLQQYMAFGSTGCQMGIFTVYDVNGASPDAVVEPNGSGLTFLAPMTDPSFTFWLRVPTFWKIDASNVVVSTVFGYPLFTVLGITNAWQALRAGLQGLVLTVNGLVLRQILGTRAFFRPARIASGVTCRLATFVPLSFAR
jgi:hypothetical protein